MASPPEINDAALNRLAIALASTVPESERVVTAESCTGGFIAQVLTAVPGSSSWFECGYVTYSNAAKMRDLAVEQSDLTRHGAVSEPVARAMALGARRRADVWAGVAVTGIAGPGGGSAQKPCGTVCFGWSLRDGRDITQRLVFDGDREAVRRATVAHAIQELIRLANNTD